VTRSDEHSAHIDLELQREMDLHLIINPQATEDIKYFLFNPDFSPYLALFKEYFTLLIESIFSLILLYNWKFYLKMKVKRF